MIHKPPVIDTPTHPIIFLAGPIRGAGDWQAEAIALISAAAPELDIASPRRPEVSLDNFEDAKFFEQVEWEHAYLDAAARHGVIMFWLPVQDHPVPGLAYAQTTEFELGEALAWHQLSGARVVVGVTDGFGNARYLRHTIAKKGPAIPLCATLAEACAAAAALARQPQPRA